MRSAPHGLEGEGAAGSAPDVLVEVGEASYSLRGVAAVGQVAVLEEDAAEDEGRRPSGLGNVLGKLGCNSIDLKNRPKNRKEMAP